MHMSMRNSFSRNLNNTAEVCASPILCSSVLRIMQHATLLIRCFMVFPNVSNIITVRISSIHQLMKFLRYTMVYQFAVSDATNSACRCAEKCSPSSARSLQTVAGTDCPVDDETNRNSWQSKSVTALESWKSCCGSRASRTWQMPLFTLRDGSC